MVSTASLRATTAAAVFDRGLGWVGTGLAVASCCRASCWRSSTAYAAPPDTSITASSRPIHRRGPRLATAPGAGPPGGSALVFCTLTSGRFLRSARLCYGPATLLVHATVHDGDALSALNRPASVIPTCSSMILSRAFWLKPSAAISWYKLPTPVAPNRRNR